MATASYWRIHLHPHLLKDMCCGAYVDSSDWLCCEHSRVELVAFHPHELCTIRAWSWRAVVHFAGGVGCGASMYLCHDSADDALCTWRYAIVIQHHPNTHWWVDKTVNNTVNKTVKMSCQVRMNENESSMLLCVALCCSVLPCAAVCCSVLQCAAAAVRCSVLQCVSMFWWWLKAVCCSVLQCVVQCVAVCCSVCLCFGGGWRQECLILILLYLGLSKQSCVVKFICVIKFFFKLKCVSYQPYIFALT